MSVIVYCTISANALTDSHKLIFQMTVRMATCRELATDMGDVTKFQRDFSLLEKSANPVTLLLPWLPTTAKKLERTSINNLRAMLRTYVEKRKKATIPNSDAIDFLLSRGLQVDRIIAVSFSPVCLPC
jgi:hypothetical protein